MILRDVDTRGLADRAVATAREQWTRRGGLSALVAALAVITHGVMAFSLVFPSSVTEWVASLLPQVFVIGLVLHLVAVGLARSRAVLVRAVGVSATAAVFVAMVIAPWNQPALAAGAAPSLRVTTYNALFTNSASPLLEPADIIGLQEITTAKLESVAQDMNAPYTFMTRCECTAPGTEVGLVSRYEISDATFFDDGGAGTFARAELAITPDKTVVVYLAQLPSPENHSGRDRRNRLLEVIRAEIASETGDVILMGDLSVTVYSTTFRALRADLNLQPVDYGFVPRCSWYGLGPLLCLRIDHIMVSSGLRIVESSVGANQGSDHRPVSATITW
jgi:endonuclease/exonuclease/phosphatase (EEP) superfamily protein YafD